MWFWITCLIAAVWLKRHLDLNRAARDALVSDADAERAEADAAGGPGWPTVSVLVAAKDEERNIQRCASGLLRQDYPRFRLILIDDRSQDRTPALIDALAAADPRVTALHVTELPAGWFGKNNAMRTGVEVAEGEWLCFSDADCEFQSPKLLRAAVGFAQRAGVEFLSVLPRLEAHSFWERVIQPVAGGVLVFWFPPQKVNDPRSRVAYANGAFMLMTRAAYERLGGHAAVRATLNEDMHFARRAKQAGVRLRVVRNLGMYSVRMYAGFHEIWRGWSRIFFGCFGTLARLIASVVVLSIFSLSPYVTLAASMSNDLTRTWMLPAAVAAIVAQQSVLWRYYPVSGLPPYLALTYPLGAAVCLAMIVNAMTRAAGGATTWRGTTYRGG